MKQLLTIISVIFATTLTSFAQNKGYVISGVIDDSDRPEVLTILTIVEGTVL